MNNLGHKSHEKVRKTVKKVNGKKIVIKTPEPGRKWSVRSNLWRQSEKPNYIHPSNMGIKKIHQVAKKFLLDVKARYERHLKKRPAESLAITKRSLGLDGSVSMGWREVAEEWSVLSST